MLFLVMFDLVSLCGWMFCNVSWSSSDISYRVTMPSFLTVALTPPAEWSPLLSVSWKTQPYWNWFQNELPPNEGREHYHFPLRCFDVQISKNMMASQRNIFFEAVERFFSWMMTASIKLMTRMVDECLILNKPGRRRVTLCQRVMAAVQS